MPTLFFPEFLMDICWDGFCECRPTGQIWSPLLYPYLR